VVVGNGVLVAVPGTGVFVRVAVGARVTDGGRVGWITVMVTAGVTGRSVAVGAEVGVWLGVSVGEGVNVEVGGVGGVDVWVGDGVKVGGP